MKIKMMDRLEQYPDKILQADSELKPEYVKDSFFSSQNSRLELKAVNVILNEIELDIPRSTEYIMHFNNLLEVLGSYYKCSWD